MTLDRETIAAYEQSRKLSDRPFRAACYAPFTSIYFNTNGDVIACCKNFTYVLGHIADERLEDIWRGKRAQAMRKAMVDYKLGVGCDLCEWQIKGGQYDQVFATIFDKLPLTDERGEWPTQMEFTLSNTCNLGCIMCYGSLSSVIRAQRDKLPPLPKVYGDQFFSDLRKFLPHLTIAKFFGGEPFLARENYRVWDMMIEDGIQIPCQITTNCTVYNENVERILEAFPCYISVSFDGVTKETVESIRLGAKWETLLENLDKFQDYTRRKKDSSLAMTYCLMRQNWHEFGEYLRFAEERGLSVFVNTVVDPVDCSLYTLEATELEDIARRMDRMGEEHGYARLEINGAVWSSAVEALHKNAREAQRQRIGEFKQAATEKNPIGKAWILVQDRKLDEALTTVAKVPDGSDQYYSRLVVEGHVHRQKGQFDEAQARLDAAVDLFPKGPNAYVERALLLLQKQRLEDALADAKQAEALLKGDPNHGVAPDAYAVLGLAYGHCGDFDHALAAIDTAVSIRPDDAWMHVHRGWILASAARPEDALAAVHRAGELSPDNPELPRLREFVDAKRAESR